MNEPTAKFGLSRSVIGTLLFFGLMGVVLFGAGPKDYPDLHVILDTGLFLLSGVLALLLWDMGARINNLLPKYLAVSFAVAALLNFIHVMVTVEWSGPLLPIAQMADRLRPGTWPPSVHVLPIGVGCSVWLTRRGKNHLWQFPLVLLVLSGAILALFNWLPRYSPPGWLGVTRPTLILSPLLWLTVGWQCWRLRAADRIMPMLALMSAVLLLANVVMLFSRAPHDPQAMVAHLFRVGGYLVLLLSMMQMAAWDMHERILAERQLVDLNQGLEQRVLDRTAQLASTNQTLEVEIAERRQAEQANAQLAAIVEFSHDAIISKSLDGVITSWNRGAEMIFGYTAGEMVGSSIMRLIPADRHAEEIQILGAIKRDERVQHFETLRQTKNGRLIDVAITASPIKDASGKIIGASKVARDISGRKTAEAALRETQVRLHSALAAGSIGTWTWDIANDRLVADEFTARMFSVEVEAAANGLPAEKYLQAVLEEDRPGVADALARAIQSCGRYDIEYRVRQKDGALHWLQARGRVTCDAAGKGLNFHGAVMDITERKRTEGRFRRLVDSNAHGVIFWNAKGEITEANDAFLRIVGYTREDLNAQRLRWTEMTPPEYAHLDRRNLDELATKGVCTPIEKEYIRKDGSRVPILIGAATFEDSPDEGVCFVLDITERKAAKDALDRERNLLRKLVDNLPACIYVKDLEGRYLLFNTASVRQVGLNSEAEAFGKTGFDFFPPEIARLYEADDRQVLISGQMITNREEPTQDSEGKPRWYLTTKIPLRDATGAIIGLLGISQDVTERKQIDQALRASEERFRFLNDLSEATRMLADPEQIMAVIARMLGEHLRASRCAYADVEQDGERFVILHDYTDGCASTVGSYQLSLFGTRAVATLHAGQTLIIRNVGAELLPGEGAEMFKAIDIQAIITCPLVKNGVLRAMMAVHQKTPRDWMRSEITLVQDVVERCWATIERRAAEEKIYQLNAELEQRVAERTKELETANRGLELADRHKSEFLAGMSHELRTPLNGIIGFGQVLLGGRPGPLNPKQSEFLGDILDNGRHLLQLINDVLDLSKVEAGRMEIYPEDFSVRKALEEVCAVAVTMAQKKNITVHRAVDPAVDAVTLDQQKFKQVLFNLLSNAVKFTNDGGRVDILVSPQDETRLRLQVTDTGIGMKAEDLGKLFVEFRQLDSGPARRHQGTGLGLALTRRIVEFQGGSIAVESEIGKGSTFTVILPLRTEKVTT